MITVRRVAGALGAEVGGVDLSKLLSAGLVAELRQAWLENLVLNATGRSESVQTWHGATRRLTLELPKMAIYNINMDISVTEFKHRCLEIIRRVETTGKPVAITRRGKVVVRLNPSGSAGHGGLKPWEQLRSLGGRLLAEPGESVLHDEDFEALR